jgi:hypothetical protein
MRVRAARVPVTGLLSQATTHQHPHFRTTSVDFKVIRLLLLLKPSKQNGMLAFFEICLFECFCLFPFGIRQRKGVFTSIICFLLRRFGLWAFGRLSLIS